MESGRRAPRIQPTFDPGLPTEFATEVTMKIGALLWFGALLAASIVLVDCGSDSSGGPVDGSVCPVSAMNGVDCMTVGEVCNDNAQSCRCTMGRRDAGSSWNCDPIGGGGAGACR